MANDLSPAEYEALEQWFSVGDVPKNTLDEIACQMNRCATTGERFLVEATDARAILCALYEHSPLAKAYLDAQ